MKLGQPLGALAWVDTDPIGMAGGINVYGFADGDPLSYDDPLGLCPLCAAAQVVAKETVKGAIVGAAIGAGQQVLINAIFDRPLDENVAKEAAIGAAIGSVTAGAGSTLRIGNAVRAARTASRSSTAAVATRAEADAAGRLFTGSPARAIRDGHLPGKPQVGIRNDATGRQYRFPHTDRGTPQLHSNLERTTPPRGNLHLMIQRWFPWTR